MTIQVKETFRIATSFERKPISNPRCDWCASFIDEDARGLRGWGATEADAIGDLLGKSVAQRLKVG